MRRFAVLLLVLVAVLGGPGEALAAEEVRTDDLGREIRFDVRAGGVDVDWYAGHLRRAPHGDEITSVVIRIVDRGGLASTCGRAASGCYARNRVVVPAGRDRATAHVLLHEYGHHLDSRRGNSAAPEPNGMPLWWRARGMEELVRVQSVRRNYTEGWSRSIGEIFAEDYAYVALGGPYGIEWLQPPDAVVRQALLADLGFAAEQPVIRSRRPAVRPVVIERSGTLQAGQRVSVTFGLLGPGRRVLVRASAGGARIEVQCGSRLRSKAVAGTTTLDVRRLGPARCSASLVSTTTAPTRFSFTVRLSVES